MVACERKLGTVAVQGGQARINRTEHTWYEMDTVYHSVHQTKQRRETRKTTNKKTNKQKKSRKESQGVLLNYRMIAKTKNHKTMWDIDK